MSLLFRENASSLVPFMGSSDSPVRSSPSGSMPIDTRREMTWSGWQKILKNSRWLTTNTGLFRRFFKATSRYAVGGGIGPIPDTGDVDFDRVLEDYFCAWADSPAVVDVYQRSTFWQLQRKVLYNWMRDGEHFAMKVPHADFVSTDGVRVMGLPRLMCFESQTIGSINEAGYDGHDKDGFVWGIRYQDHAPIEYKLRLDHEGTIDMTRVDKVPAEQMLWMMDPERIQQPRGVPWMHHGINSLIDILDLTALEKHTQKLHSAVAAAIKRKVPDPKKGATGTVSTEKKADKNGKTRIVAFENFLAGAGILQLALDEDFVLQSSGRDTNMFVGLINHLVRDICIGFDCSPDFFWSHAELQGPSARMVLEDAQSLFESLQDLLVSQFCVPVYYWVIARAIERREVVVPAKVKDPFACHWQGPAKVTIDQGREGELELDRLASGCGTWAEYWNKRGKSGRKMVFSRIDELAQAMEYAASKKGPGHEDGVPFDYVMRLDKGGSGNADNKEEIPAKPKAKKTAKKS